MLFQMPFAVSFLGMNAMREGKSGAFFLMISTKNWQECCVWVVLDLAGGTGGRGHAPRWMKPTGSMCAGSIGTGRVSGSTETKTYGKGAAGREHEEKQTLPRRDFFGKDIDER